MLSYTICNKVIIKVVARPTIIILRDVSDIDMIHPSYIIGVISFDLSIE